MPCHTHFVRSFNTHLACLLSLSIAPLALAQQENAIELDDIEVTSYHEALGEAPPARSGGQVATGARMGILGNAEVMDTPFSVTSYTEQTIEDRHAQSMVDLLAADPAVRQSGPRTHVTESLRIRGYSVGSSSYAVGGMFGLSPGFRTYLEPFERVEVIKGPSAALFGMSPGGTIGGVINLVPKRAKATPTAKVTFTAAQDSTLGLHLDVGRRFASDAIGVRVNLMQREGDTAMDWQTTRRKLASIGTDFRYGRLSASLDVIHSLDDVNNITRPFNIPASMTKLPRAPHGKNTYAGGGDYESLDRTWVARLEYALTDQLTAYLGYGEHRFRTDGILIYPTFINTAGDYSYVMRQWKQADDDRSMQAGFRGFTTTFGITHQFALDWSALDRNGSTAVPNFGGGNLNIYLPASARRIPRPRRSKAPTIPGTSTELESLALADTLGFWDDRVLLSLGIRHQNVFSKAHSTGRKYDKSADTPFVGVVYKIAPFASLYASYVEGLQQGGTAGNDPSYSNPNEQLPPYVAKQKEVGIKYDGGALGAGLALFTTEKPHAFVNNDWVFTESGQDRHRGAELTVYGQPWRGVRLLGGVTLLDAKQRNTGIASRDGKRVIGVAKQQANLGVEWDVQPHWSLSARAVATGSRYANAANTMRVAGWVRYDLGARYMLDLPGEQLLTLRIQIENVTNRNDWVTVGGFPGQGHLSLGAPRTFRLNATWEF